jgi:hypothetical protein
MVPLPAMMENDAACYLVSVVIVIIKMKNPGWYSP